MRQRQLDPVHIPLRGVHLIEASAGTGKTYSITGLYVRLLLEEELRPEEILVVTYTDAACKELRDAIRTRVSHAYQLCAGTDNPLNQSAVSDTFLCQLFETYRQQGRDFRKLASRLRLAITEFDLSAIYTIHGFCTRVLHDHAFESGFPFETEFIENDSTLLQEIIDDFWIEKSRRWSSLFSSYLCHEKLSPDTLVSRISKLLKIMLVAGLDAVRFSAISEPEVLEDSDLGRLGEIWLQERETLMVALDESKALGRAEKTYRKDNLARWFQELDRFFVEGSSVVAPVLPIAKFSASALLASAKKGKAQAVPRHEFFTLCEKMTKDLKSARNGLLRELLKHCQDNLQRLKIYGGLISFDDLLTGVRDALRRPKTGKLFAREVGRKYPIALIDEFQDTDPVQYEIFSTIYHKGHYGRGLFLVGDPKQAIYGFRGADIYAYLEAARAQVDGIHSLTVNWRSEPGLIKACNYLFAQQAFPPFIFTEIEFHPALSPERDGRRLQVPSLFSASMTLAVFEDQKDKQSAQNHIARWLTCQVAALLDHDAPGNTGFVEMNAEGTTQTTPLKASDIAILVRSHQEGSMVKSALTEQGIHAVIQSRESVFHTLEAREIELILYAVIEPTNERCLRAALATRLLGVSVQGLAELDKNRQWEEWLARILDYKQIWLKRGVAPMLYELFNKEKSFIRMSRLVNGERIVTNVRHLIELFQQAVHDYGLKPESLIQWIKENRHDTEQKDGSQIRLESDENLVQIVTIHKSKGLQYPVVFCPFLWDSRLTNVRTPDYVVCHDADGKLLVDYDTESFATNFLQQQKEELAEELRLLYVAVTRAQHRCIITWGRVSSRNKCRTATSALQYLLNGLASDDVVCGNTLLEDLQAFFKKYSFTEWVSYFQALSRNSGGAIGVVDVSDDDNGIRFTPEHEVALLPAKHFTRQFNFQHSIHSFSSLHSHGSTLEIETPDYDQGQTPIPTDDLVLSSKMDMFSFPRGPQAGSCLHGILEYFDFQENDEEQIKALVSQQLLFYGFDLEWMSVVSKFLTEMVSVEFGGDQENPLSLNQVSTGQRLDEMEFYYTVPALAEDRLRRVFLNDHRKLETVEIARENFMKGFIDSIFQWNSQFYIMDYKSNYLGSTYDAYKSDSLQSAMETAGYDLQYRIYTLALHRYLTNRLPGYNYETHFGGVYYLFLRGLSVERGSGTGVYFDRPEWAEIEAINKQLRTHRL